MNVTFTGSERKSVIIVLRDGENLGDIEGPANFCAKVDGASPIWVELLRQRVKVIDPVLKALDQDAEVDIAASLDDRTHNALGASDAPHHSIYPSDDPAAGDPMPLSAYPDVVAAKARAEAADPELQQRRAKAEDKTSTAADQAAARKAEKNDKNDKHKKAKHR